MKTRYYNRLYLANSKLPSMCLCTHISRPSPSPCFRKSNMLTHFLFCGRRKIGIKYSDLALHNVDEQRHPMTSFHIQRHIKCLALFPRPASLEFSPLNELQQIRIKLKLFESLLLVLEKIPHQLLGQQIAQYSNILRKDVSIFVRSFPIVIENLIRML